LGRNRKRAGSSNRSRRSNVSFIPGTGTGRGQGAGAVGITYPSYLGQEQVEGREQEQLE
jgi:hypothetical protein